MGIWIGGHTVYGSCILVANIVLLHRFHTHTFLSFCFLTGGVFCFFFAMGVENNYATFKGIYRDVGE